MSTVIRVENLSKSYQLGVIGGKTLRDDFQRWLAKMRGRPDPLLKIGQADHASRAGEIIWALKDVSFEVQQGEVLGIIGRNGAGKSTLLKILSRVTAPTSGVVKVKGRIASLLEVGTGFHPELTGRENIYLNGSILGMRRWEIDKKLDEIVDFSGVEKFIDTPVKRYSSGMYVRLAFAVAAHLDPEILVVDEVLAVGDAEFQKKCLGKMGEVAQGGRTVLFVSHNMAAVERISSRAFILDKGNVVAQGPTSHVIKMYLDDQSSKQTEIWERPNAISEKPHFKKLRICDKNGNTLKTISSSSEIAIEIHCFIPENNPRIKLGLAVYSNIGQALFSVSPIDDNISYPIQKGEHFYRVVFPPAIFMPQQYTITVALYENHISHEQLLNVLSFDVTSVASLANLGDTLRPGVLQIQTNWYHKII